MKVAVVFLLCVLGATLLATVHANNSGGPDDCCFKYYPRRLPASKIKDYYMTDDRCAKYAAVLVTNSSRHFCVNPDLPWVEKIMKTLDEAS